MRPFLTLLAGLALLAPSPALAAPALWQVSDANSSIWLFGSIHGLPREGNEWRTPLLNDRITAADRIWFETDIGPAGMAALTVKSVVQAFTASQQEPWIGKLDDADQQRLATALARVNLTLEQAGAMPPWLVVMQLAQLQMQTADQGDLDFTKGVDFVLEWELPAERKAYFETPGEQFDMIAGGSLDDQIAQIRTTLDELDGPATDDMTALVGAWQSGDLAAIEQLIAKESESDPDFITRLLHDRNRNWLPKIEDMLATDQSNLVVVGAAHLAGDDSVIDLLAKAGYTVTRLQ